MSERDGVHECKNCVVYCDQIKRLQGYMAEADEKLLQRDQDYDDCLVEISRLEKEIAHLEKLLAKAE